MNRFEQMQELLCTKKFFKLVCGAGNEDAEEVKRLSLIYTIASAKGLDISANIDVVKAANEGVDLGIFWAKKLGVKINTRPFITVSVGMKGDHHVRKANISLEICSKCKLCIPVCPTQAINSGLVVNKSKCIGCGNCLSICPGNDVITFNHNELALLDILPKCKDEGVEQFELHAAIANDDSIMEEWKIIDRINHDGHISMCLDRLHLSDFALESRIKRAKEIAGERLLIQADGYPMSGGKDDFNTTLQAVAIADVINKRFNKVINKKTKETSYKKYPEINILLSGGTNSLTALLARQNNVAFQGVSIGTFARKLVKDIISYNNFYDNEELIKHGYLVAKKLVVNNIGNYNE